MLEDILQVVAVMVMVCGAIFSGLLLLLSRGGIAIGFVTAFTAVICIPAAAALLAGDFLYSGSLTYARFSEFVWLLIPASLASVLVFDLLWDLLMSRHFRLRIQRELRFGLLEAFGRGIFVSLMIVAASRLLPQAAEVTVVAALVAGLISAAVRYYISLALTDSSAAETSLLFDEETGRRERDG